jgi:hypothetical protein
MARRQPGAVVTIHTYTGGTDTSDRAARDDLRRRQRERFAKQSAWPELRRKHLRSEKFAIVHEPTGDEYRIYAGEIDLGPTHPIHAFFYAASGQIVFLERIGGPR